MRADCRAYSARRGTAHRDTAVNPSGHDCKSQQCACIAAAGGQPEDAGVMYGDCSHQRASRLALRNILPGHLRILRFTQQFLNVIQKVCTVLKKNY